MSQARESECFVPVGGSVPPCRWHTWERGPWWISPVMIMETVVNSPNQYLVPPPDARSGQRKQNVPLQKCWGHCCPPSIQTDAPKGVSGSPPILQWETFTNTLFIAYCRSRAVAWSIPLDRGWRIWRHNCTPSSWSLTDFINNYHLYYTHYKNK